MQDHVKKWYSKITGLTRKALEYYEEKGFIHPRRLENGYREYSEKDVEILNKIALFKKLGLSITEIKDCLKSDGATASSILRRKEQELEKWWETESSVRSLYQRCRHG